MSSFVKSANLPNQVDELIIGQKYSGILNEGLERNGIKPIYLPDNPHVDRRLSAHSDLSVLHMGSSELFLAPYLRGTLFEKRLRKTGAELIFPEIAQSAQYPHDAQLNLCAAGNVFFCNRSCSDAKAVDYLTSICGLRPLNVRQGYARCSMCVVGEGAVITADRGMYTSASDNGLDALLISAGFIELRGFEYGFIGGSTFKLSAERLAFTGSLDRHPDKTAILDFLKAHEVKPVFLTELPLFDVGSAIPLTEKQ